MFVRFLLPADPPELPVPLPVLLLLTPIVSGVAEQLRRAGWVAGSGADFTETATSLRFDESGGTVTVTVDGAPVFTEPSADASSFAAWESAVTQFDGEVLLIATSPDAAASLLAGGTVDQSALMRGGHGTFARIAVEASDASR